MKRFLKPVSTKLQQADGRTLVKNSLARTELEQYKTYEYDSFNKATKVIVEDYTKGSKEVHIQRNYYDAENLHYGIEEDGEQTSVVNNGWSVFIELDAKWKPTKRLVRGYGIVASEEIEQSAEREPKSFAEIQNQKLAEKYHFYHQNEHGDTEYTTGSNGEVTNAYTYDAFGTITNSSELVKNRYTYNGEQYDQISQQYYLRARNYNPLIGRFTQEDVYRGDGLNLYAYCGNNPVMYVDPSGYSFTFPSDIYIPGTDVDTYVDPSRVDYGKAEIKRTSPGIVTGNFTCNIPVEGNKIVSADYTTIAIPQEIANQMVGKKYDSFADFRRDFWKKIGNSNYANEFSKNNQTLMKKGMAPYAPTSLHSNQFGGKYNIDHTIEIQDGGYVFDFDNMSIIAPKTHEEKTKLENQKRKSSKC